MTNPTCEIDFKDDKIGQAQVPAWHPAEAKQKVGGRWACSECIAFIKKEVKRRSGANAINVWQAMRRSN